MKILIISPYLPWPLHGGSSVRIFNLLEGFHKMGHEIILLSGSNDCELKNNNPLQEICKKIYFYKLPKESRFLFVLKSFFSSKPYPFLRFQATTLKEKIICILSEENIDVVWVNFSIIADMIPEDINKKIPVILDQHECEEMVYMDYLLRGSLVERLFALLNLAKLKKFKQNIFLKINAIVSVSEEEADFTKKQVKGKLAVWVAPNGVSKDFLIQHKIPIDNNIIFCANMSVRRNVDAALWFAKKIFPLVKNRIPNAKFYIIGANPDRKILDLAKIPGIYVTGTVDDIKKYYQMGRVFVSPYRFGAGTKLKVLEAMASGIPIVSTLIGCRGIKVVDNKHLLIADKENDFGEKVIELIINSKKSNELAENSLLLVKKEYSWENISKKIESNILKIK